MRGHLSELGIVSAKGRNRSSTCEGRSLAVRVARMECLHHEGAGRGPLDIGAREWYTRLDRACDKPLILLSSLALRGNPSLSAMISTKSIT
jgi:hypothetical protein